MAQAGVLREWPCSEQKNEGERMVGGGLERWARAGQYPVDPLWEKLARAGSAQFCDTDSCSPGPPAKRERQTRKACAMCLPGGCVSRCSWGEQAHLLQAMAVEYQGSEHGWGGKGRLFQAQCLWVWG